MESHLRPGFWSSRALCWPRRHRAPGRSGRDPPELLAGVDVGAQVRLVHCFRLQKSFLKPGSRVRRSLGEPSCRSITPSHPPSFPPRVPTQTSSLTGSPTPNRIGHPPGTTIFHTLTWPLYPPHPAEDARAPGHKEAKLARAYLQGSGLQLRGDGPGRLHVFCHQLRVMPRAERESEPLHLTSPAPT